MINRRRAGSFLIIAFALLAISRDDGQFSLEQILSSPFPAGRDKLARVFHDEGRLNSWVAEAPDYGARQLTNYTQDEEILVFSPDGRPIAFIRPLNVADTYSVDRERIIPWAIYVADVQSGQACLARRSGDSEMESFRRALGEDALQWAATDQLLFCSEQGLGASSQRAGQRWPGQTARAGRILGPASRPIPCGHSCECWRYLRHLWKVIGPVQQITRGDGIEMNPVILKDGMIAFPGSTARDPHLPQIASADGSHRT